MRKKLGLSLILLFAFSSIFFIDLSGASLPIQTIGKVEAAICPPGQYPNQGTDGMLKNGQCQGTETYSDGEGGSETAMMATMIKISSIYNIVAGVLLAISIVSIILVGYIYISPFQITKLNGGGGKFLNVQDNTQAKMYLISIGLGIVLILSGFSIMRLITEILGL